MIRVIHRLYSSARDVQSASLTSAIALAKGREVPDLKKKYGQASIHLLRALLRQCTYLPDPEARRYLHFYVITRFRDYCPRIRPGKIPRPRKLAAVRKRAPDALGNGKRKLGVLIRANEGHPDDLHKVLATTYGRRGKRKHTLLQALKVKGSPDDMDAVAKLSTPSRRTSKEPQLTETMIALLKSQKAQKDMGFDKSFIKHLKPMIEKENAWGRPMPSNRVNNQAKEWYAKTLDAIQPPLPAHEWHRLGDLATGRIPWEGPVPRRKQGTVRDGSGKGVPDTSVDGMFSEEDLHDSDEEAPYTFVGQKFVEKELSKQNTRNDERNRDVKTNAHNLTPRYMRSLWARVYVKCPMMTWDTEKKRWDVQWGNVEEEKEIVPNPHQQGDSSLFEGVDESGEP